MADFKVKGVMRGRAVRRTVITAAVVVLVLVLVWFQRASIMQVVSAMSKGALVPLVAAAACEGVRIVLHAYAYTRSFRVIGSHVPLRATVPAWFKMIFMNTVLPSGGTSGMAAVVDSARKHGVAVGSATSATLFTQTCYYSSMFLIIVAGFAVMANAGTLTTRDVLVGSVMGVAALAFVALLALGHFKPGLLQRCLRWVERLVVRLCKRIGLKKTPKPWADNLVHSFSSAATELSRHPRRALAVFGVMFVAMMFDLLAFVASGYAFGITRIDALFAGYVCALVFNSFTVTPGGVGVVEGLSSAILAGYGYPGTLSISAVLTYRALMYWIPFVVGGVMMRVTKAFTSTDAARPAEADAGSALEPEPAEVYVSRRRPEEPLVRRAFAFARNTLKLRTVLCGLVVAATAIAALFTSGSSPEPLMVEAVTHYVTPDGPISPVFMVVLGYVLLLCVPGILINDQGVWLVSLVGVLGLGVATALAAHGLLVMVLVLASLALLVMWHRCFTGHGFLKSVVRLVGVLAYGVAVALLYALVGSLLNRASIDPDPGILGALWLGLQALVTFPAPPDGSSYGADAVWFYGSVRVVTVTLTCCMLFVLVQLAIRRTVEWRRPERVAARAKARAEAQAAADERKAVRKQRRWEVYAGTRARIEDFVRGMRKKK